MSWSSCPFCSQQVLSIQLERHANNHFEDEDLAMAIQLQNEDIASDVALSSSVDNPIRSQGVGTSYGGGSTSDEKVRCLDVKHSLITLLNKCLECDSGNATSILSGYVDHFQSVDYEDVGWGCGWRNIQMMSSHLLVQRQEAKEVLFGGSGYVPDIPSLQKWLEIAWGKGFDTPGSLDFDQKIFGKRSWIGTTECAALFRSFGVRARIVDFTAVERGTSVGKRKVTGPMDKYVKRPMNTDAASSKENAEMGKGHQLLADWVWSYFSSDNKPGCNRVVVTEKSPLYFQHDGHSRTIIGIQLKSQSLPNGMKQYNLLILDPAHKTKVLESCLDKKAGWQRFIKRGVHTLKKLDYQLCYIDRGIASGAEMEKLKTLDSTRFEF